MADLTVPVTDRDHIEGPASATVTLVEYGDYQCPYCGQAYGVIKETQRRFGDQLRFVFRNFPLQEMHPYAVSAAMTAEFAAQHGQFWPVHDALYENQQRLGEGLYEAIITEVGLDPAALREAMRSDSLLARIQADVDGGEASGVQGTPGFFLNGDMFEDGYPELPGVIAQLV